MALHVSSEVVDSTAKVLIDGEIDSASAPALMGEIEKVIQQKPSTLVFDMEHLSFMSSAGLRVIIFSKQKLGPDVPIYLVKPQESIVSVLEKTGFQHSVNIVEEFNN